jgi:hypothetical protein
MAAAAAAAAFLGDLEIPAVGLRVGLFRRGDVLGTGGGLRTTSRPTRLFAFAAVNFAEAFALATVLAFAFPELAFARTDFFARVAAFFLSLFAFSTALWRAVAIFGTRRRRRRRIVFVVVVVVL